MQWNKTYGGKSYDLALSLVQSNDSGYGLAGYTSSYNAGKHSFWLIKTDRSGNMEWNKTYGVDSDAYSLIQSSDGGYALAGIITNIGIPFSKAWLVKTDASGKMQWNNTFSEPAEDYYVYSLLQTAEGGYALAGRCVFL